MSGMIMRAAAFAKTAHSNQKRKYTGEPYFWHVAAVAGRTAAWAQIPEVVCVAYLHDTVEDCDVTLDQISKEFSPYVAEGVNALTNPSKGSKLPRAERKKMDRDHLVGIAPQWQRIKLEDRVHNVLDFLDNCLEEDFVNLYIKETKELLKIIGYTDEKLSNYLIEKMERYLD